MGRIVRSRSRRQLYVVLALAAWVNIGVGACSSEPTSPGGVGNGATGANPSGGGEAGSSSGSFARGGADAGDGPGEGGTAGAATSDTAAGAPGAAGQGKGSGGTGGTIAVPSDAGAGGTIVGSSDAGAGGVAGLGGESAHATITVDGGSITVGDVTLEIPAGALDVSTDLTLRVLDDAGTIRVDPDLDLNLDATVWLDGALTALPDGTPVQHLNPDGEWYYDAEITHTNGRAGYLASTFSPRRVVTVLPELLSNHWNLSDATPAAKEAEATGARNPDLRPKYGSACLTTVGGIDFDLPTIDPDKRHFDEAITMSVPAASAMSRAAAAVAASAELGGSGYKLYLNGALDSYGTAHGNHGQHDSYHRYGAAADVTLCKMVGTSCVKVKNLASVDRDKMELLGDMLWTAGFTWVWYEDAGHYHASVTSPECGVGPLPCPGGASCTYWWDTRPSGGASPSGTVVAVTLDGIKYDAVDMHCCHDRGLAPNGASVTSGYHTIEFSLQSLGAGASSASFYFLPTMYDGAYEDYRNYVLYENGNVVPNNLLVFSGPGVRKLTARVY